MSAPTHPEMKWEQLAVERALTFVAAFGGDPRCSLNCVHSEALAAEVYRLRALLADPPAPAAGPQESVIAEITQRRSNILTHPNAIYRVAYVDALNMVLELLTATRPPQ